jgi:hypothetical protein
MRKPRYVSLNVLELALIAALPEGGQTVYGSIAGTVPDATGEMMPPANAMPGNDGNYVFVNLLR